MSTQLILYPQNYEGQVNSTATPVLNEYLVNRVSFTGLNSTTLYNTTNLTPSRDAIENSPPSILGNWFRFTTTGSPWGNVTAPAVTSNNLVLSQDGATTGHTGVYQQLSGLIVGNIYKLRINISTQSADGVITVETYSGLGSSATINSPSSDYITNVVQISHFFTAQSTNDTVLINFATYGTSGDLTISSMSITESGVAPTLVYSDLEDGQVICDLYQEEDIPLTLSIDDFKNVAEQIKSYSKDFSLPATKRNNQIFNNMFEVTRSNDGIIFNPYLRTQCALKQDGFILFEGYLRMLDIKDKEGEISYDVNLFSEITALADILKDLTFETLDFEELEHSYVISNIRNSWEPLGAGDGLLLTNSLPTTSLAYDSVTGVNNTQVLKYPYIDWSHQFYLDSGSQIILSNLETAFRPCIQLKYLVNKIFENTPFSYTSSFFNSTDFEKLFMDFNWGENENGAAPLTVGNFTQTTNGSPQYFFNSTFTKFELGNNTAGVNTLWDNTDYRFVSPVNNLAVTAVYYLRIINVSVSDRGNALRIAKFNSLGQVLETFAYDNNDIDAGQYKVMEGTLSTVLSAGDYIQAQGSAPTASTVAISQVSPLSNIEFTYDNDSSQAWTLLYEERGKLGQWDFLKGIMTMFNLVSLIDENDPNNILIEPYADIFLTNSNSKELDWTDKVDVSEMELKPLTDLNKKTIFKFVEDDDDYVFNSYKKSTSGHLYGSQVLEESEQSILQGTEEIIAEPFAATISKSIIDSVGYEQFVVPAVYSVVDDGTSQSFANLPRIFYNNEISNGGDTYTCPAQNGESAITLGLYLLFSHFSVMPAISSAEDFVFQSVQLFPNVTLNGISPVNNLYSNYWQPYFNELYNADTRIMTLKVNLSPSDVASFKFYDTVFIKNRSFRVNKIEYKPNELATVEFILIA